MQAGAAAADWPAATSRSAPAGRVSRDSSLGTKPSLLKAATNYQKRIQPSANTDDTRAKVCVTNPKAMKAPRARTTMEDLPDDVLAIVIALGGREAW